MSGQLPPRIVLVGFMAAGKTTVGRLLAERAGVPFVDLDERIERAAGRSVAEIFADQGEPAFREWEARLTRSLDAERPAVIAVGGGWMTRPELRDRWPDAVRVWLRVTPEAVLRRVGEELASRPLLARADDPGRSIRKLMRRRESAYARAEVSVETTGRTPARIVERILEALAGAPPRPEAPDTAG